MVNCKQKKLHCKQEAPNCKQKSRILSPEDCRMQAQRGVQGYLIDCNCSCICRPPDQWERHSAAAGGPLRDAPPRLPLADCQQMSSTQGQEILKSVGRIFEISDMN